MEFIYQDSSILVCVKPAGVLSTDEPGGMPELARAALGEPQGRVRTVHRLDRVVSGLMVLARTPEAASQLSRQIREQRFEKEYLAVLHGRPQAPEGALRDLLRRDKAERKTYVTEVPGKDVQGGHPLLPSLRKLQRPVPSAHPAADRQDPPNPGSVLCPGPPPWWGTGNTACWTTAPHCPVVSLPTLLPSGQREAHDLPPGAASDFPLDPVLRLIVLFLPCLQLNGLFPCHVGNGHLQDAKGVPCTPNRPLAALSPLSGAYLTASFSMAAYCSSSSKIRTVPKTMTLR